MSLIDWRDEFTIGVDATEKYPTHSAKAPYKKAWANLLMIELRQRRPKIGKRSLAPPPRVAWQPA